MLRLLVCTALITILLYQHADACSCIQTDTHSKFCSAAYALKGRVLEEELIWQHGYNATTDPQYNMAQYRYRVRLMRNIKGGFKSKFIYVSTAGNSAMCGARLPVFKRGPKRRANVWLLTGYISKGGAMISICDWYSPWRSLSRKTKRALRNGQYEAGC